MYTTLLLGGHFSFQSNRLEKSTHHNVVQARKPACYQYRHIPYKVNNKTVGIKTSDLGFGNLADIHGYYGAHGTAPDALQYPAHVQHPGGLWERDHQPPEDHVRLADDERHSPAEHRRHGASRNGTDHGAHAKQRARGRHGHGRHLEADGGPVLQHRQRWRGPSEHRADDESSQRRCNGRIEIHVYDTFSCTTGVICV